MYNRYQMFRLISQNLVKPRSFQRPIGFQFSTNFVRNFSVQSDRESKSDGDASSRGNDAFLDLTMDYNRRRSVRTDTISVAIKNINDSISERLSLLILTAAARCVHNLTPEKRVELLEETWSTLQEKKVRLTTRHYETYLSGLNENGFIFDADYYLKLIDKEVIQPTPRLYSLLLTQYCREGNTDRAQSFLKMLKERNISIDEDIFAALIVCQLKLGNEKGANDIIQIMKERGLQPTISTYKEILTVLISEHRLQQFQLYYDQITAQHVPSSSSSSTLYVDANFLLFLLGQCISYKERPIFDFLMEKLKKIDHKRIPNNLFNLATQCISNSWHDTTVELLQMSADEGPTQNKESPYLNIHGRQWVLFFKQLIENNETDLIDAYLDLMMKKQLTPLDAILRVMYSDSSKDLRPVLNYIERGQEFRHPMRTNYFYPLLLNAYSPEMSKHWTDQDRLRLFRLLDRLSIPIESSTYSRIIQEPFLNYHKGNFQPLLELLAKDQLQSILDRICRLLLTDIQRRILPLDTIEQIVPYFRSNLATRQNEIVNTFISLMKNNSKTDDESDSDDDDDEKSNKTKKSNVVKLSSIFRSIDRMSKQVADENPTLKRDLFVALIQYAVRTNRKDLVEEIAAYCAKANLKIAGSINEVDSLTGSILSQELLEKLARYQRGELSWQEKLASTNFDKINPNALEQIYREAVEDGRYPLDVQLRLLDHYLRKRTIEKAMKIFRELLANGGQVGPTAFHRLFDMISAKLEDQQISSRDEYRADLQYLRQLYEKSFSIADLPPGLMIRLAHTDLLNGDQDQALKLITSKLGAGLNEEIYSNLMKFLQTNSTLLNFDGLAAIGRLFLSFRSTEPIRHFWNLFFDIMSKKGTSQDLVQFYSDAMRENSHVPYSYLFQLFIEKDDLSCLQDIVDVASLQHGSNNVLHDLGFALIQANKVKQAEKVFKTSWLKAKNDRINLHATIFADSNNIDALINSIKLTEHLTDINQKPLYSAAIRVATRLERSDIIDDLIEKVKEKHVQLDNRVRRYLDAHLLARGLDPLNVVNYDEDSPEEKQNNQSTAMTKQDRKIRAQTRI